MRTTTAITEGSSNNNNNNTNNNNNNVYYVRDFLWAAPVNISLGARTENKTGGDTRLSPWRFSVVLLLLGLADKLKIKSFMSNAEIAKTHAEKANYSNYSQGLPCAECCDECCAGIPGI